jgi:hypothetical protein
MLFSATSRLGDFLSSDDGVACASSLASVLPPTFLVNLESRFRDFLDYLAGLNSLGVISID